MTEVPDIGPIYVDSHAHLDLCGDPEAAVREAREAGVARILAVGIDIKSSRMAVEFASTFPGVLACVGIHPHDSAAVDKSALEELGKLAESPGVVAIGETGLDYYRDRAPRLVQETAFRHQIELARTTGLPLVVHTREAAPETLRILTEAAEGLTVILHCFSLYRQLEECSRRGYYMSVAGNVSFKNATELKESVKAIPPDLILTETDCPFLTPVPFRGKPNRPAFARYVAEGIADLRGEQVELFAARVRENFERAFQLDPA